MFGVEATSSYVLTLGLLTVFVLVWVTRQQKTKRDATIWLISGIVGTLLGAAGAMTGTYALGFQVTETPPPATPGEPPSAGGGGMGGGQGPRPKQQLTTLVSKLELLTSDIVLNLTDEQRQTLTKHLDEFAELKTLTDDEAEKSTRIYWRCSMTTKKPSKRRSVCHELEVAEWEVAEWEVVPHPRQMPIRLKPTTTRKHSNCCENG